MNKGTVLGVYSKDWGAVKLWSFKLEGDQTFWRCGREQPNFDKGSHIEFDADSDNNVDATSIKILKEAPIESTKDAPTPSTGVDTNNRIRYQAARADAVRIVATGMQTDHLPMANNTAKAKKLDLVLGYVEEVTKQLLEQEENNK